MQVLYRNVCRIDGLFDSVQFDLQDCDKLVALKEVSQRENLSCHKPSRIVTSALLSWSFFLFPFFSSKYLTLYTLTWYSYTSHCYLYFSYDTDKENLCDNHDVLNYLSFPL